MHHPQQEAVLVLVSVWASVLVAVCVQAIPRRFVLIHGRRCVATTVGAVCRNTPLLVPLFVLRGSQSYRLDLMTGPWHRCVWCVWCGVVYVVWCGGVWCVGELCVVCGGCMWRVLHCATSTCWCDVVVCELHTHTLHKNTHNT